MTYFSLGDLGDEAGDVPGGEGVLEGGHLIEAATQRPDVRLVVVGQPGEQLGTLPTQHISDEDQQMKEIAQEEKENAKGEGR